MLNPYAKPFVLTKTWQQQPPPPPPPPLPSFSYYKLSPFLNRPSFNPAYPLRHPLLHPTLLLPSPTSSTLLKNNTYPTTKDFPVPPLHPNSSLRKISVIAVGPRKSFRRYPHGGRSLPPRQRRNKPPPPPPPPPVLIWRPKTTDGGRKHTSEGEESAVPSSRYDFNDIEAKLEKKTTVMVKNIPNRLSKKMLIKHLDQHCLEENKKLKKSDEALAIPSTYDFVYLPMDFRTKLNLGYAFVNFTNAEGAVRFHESYNKHKWVYNGSNKICEVKHARIQGKEELVKNFQGSYFYCDTDDYLPTVFTPPRNGAESTVAETTTISYIGRRRGRPY